MLVKGTPAACMRAAVPMALYTENRPEMCRFTRPSPLGVNRWKEAPAVVMSMLLA